MYRCWWLVGSEMFVWCIPQPLRRNKQGIRKNPLKSADFRGFLVRVARLERAASTSQMSRATNCTTPGYLVVMIIARKSCDWKFFPVCSHLCGQSGFWRDFSAQENSANACVARGSGLWLFPSWIDEKSLPKQVRYQLRYTRLFSFLSGWAYSPKHIHTPVHASEENMG